jgi:hypothetical protein
VAWPKFVSWRGKSSKTLGSLKATTCFSPLHFESASEHWGAQDRGRQHFRYRPVRPGDNPKPTFPGLLASRFFDRQHHIEAANRADFLDQLPRTVTEPFAMHPHLQASPERQRQKADQDVRFDPLGFPMKDRPQAQIVLADLERIFGLA